MLTRTRTAALISMVVWLVASSLPRAGAAASSPPAFTLTVRGLPFPYRQGAIFALPQEQLALNVRAPASRLHSVDAPLGRLLATGPNTWTWQAPVNPGDYELKVEDPGGSAKVKVNAFVMVPASAVSNGVLKGYRIGEYPSVPLRGDPIYQPPRGFVEVTKDNEDDEVSPHFRLKQFVSKQESGYPKFLLLDERLILALEMIGRELEPLKYDAGDIHVMSGYRTPFYNRAIGNVEYSLHQFGRAADIFIDKDDNGVMDDLNKDKRIDRADAQYLSEIINGLSKTPDGQLIGGVGVYSATSAHGPFVHVDVRPRRARW